MPCSGNDQLLNCAFFLLVRDRAMMAEAVRSVATLAKARQRRPLTGEMAGHLRNVVTGLGDLGVFARHRLHDFDDARGVLVLVFRGSRRPTRPRG